MPDRRKRGKPQSAEPAAAKDLARRRKKPLAVDDPRRAARLAAVQALYQMALSGASRDRVIAEFKTGRSGMEIDGDSFPDFDPEMFTRLVRGVHAETDQLDDMIAAVLSEGLDVDRMETLLRIIVRAGTYEIANWLDVPVRVIVSEYVDVADAFYDKRETALTNAILDRIGQTLRRDEFEGKVRDPTPTAE